MKGTCHPSERSHALIANVLGQALLPHLHAAHDRQRGEASAETSEPWPAVTAQDAYCRDLLADGASASARGPDLFSLSSGAKLEGSAAVRARREADGNATAERAALRAVVRGAARSWVSWTPHRSLPFREGLRPLAPAGNFTRAVLGRCDCARSVDAEVQITALGSCNVEGRHDCKVGIVLPCCTGDQSAGVAFDLMRAGDAAPPVGAIHWKAQGGDVRVVGIDRDGQPRVLPASRLTNPCFRTLNMMRPHHTFWDMLRDDWWLPRDGTAALQRLVFCAEATTSTSEAEGLRTCSPGADPGAPSNVTLHWVAAFSSID